MITPEDKLYQLLKDYDVLAINVASVLAEPHAIDTMRLALKKFREAEGRYPHEIHSVLETYLANSRKAEVYGQILHGGD